MSVAEPAISRAVSPERAGHIARDLFALTPTNVEPLVAERDHNFRLTTQTDGTYVLKIAHPDSDPATLDMQNQVLEHLARLDPDLPVPRLVRAVDGASIGLWAAPGGERRLRLLTYLPGTMLKDVPQTPQLRRNLGGFLARLDTALQGFNHPATCRHLQWDLKHAGFISKHLGAIADAAERGLVRHFLARFRQSVEPALPRLRAAVIHNDANDHNVLVDPTDPGRIAGLIDFGDVVHTPRISELAVAAAYAILGQPDPLRAAADIVAGYHAESPLEEPELAVLFDLIAMRLCVSVNIAATRAAHATENPYLLVSQQPAWDMLARLAALNPDVAHFAFRAACGLPPSPRYNRVVGWLNRHAAGFASVLDRDLATAKKLLFDFTAGGRDTLPADAPYDAAAMTKQLWKRLEAAGAEIGIGAYDEDRTIYPGDNYVSEVNAEERRTVHTGIDLFVPPGTPIHAPLDGMVFSAQVNADRFDYGPTLILEHRVEDSDGSLVFHTLYGHLSEDSLAGMSPGRHVTAGERIAWIGDFPANGDWPPHLHFQVMTHTLGLIGNFPGVAARSQRALWRSICPDPSVILRIPAELSHSAGRDVPALQAARDAHIGRALSVAYDRPLKIVRGCRQFLYDHTGRAYLDAVNNISHVGHCHPHVVAALADQSAILNTNTRYLHDGLLDYAERLCGLFPDPLGVCFFVCSGSEANELALRLAGAHTGRRGVVVVDGAYHGNTSALIDISPYKFDGSGGAGRPAHVQVVPMPDGYRGRYRTGAPDLAAAYAGHVDEAFANAAAQENPAGAFICESLLGCGGQIVLPDGYLQQAYQHARAAGGVCIADEVQTGFGRVGSRFWGFETQGVVPDIVTLGKPMGNGHPLAAVVTTPAVAASFANGMEYFNSFGGNPVSCAVGMAVLDVIADEELQENADAVGRYLLGELAGLMERHPVIGDVRGRGLFIGVELAEDRESRSPAAERAHAVANAMREAAVLISTDGPQHNVLKIKPPLVFTQSDAARLVSVLDAALSATG